MTRPSPHPLKTPITERLGCRYPVIQTAMGWVANPVLVAASCEAGAFGFLAAATMQPSEVKAAIAQVRMYTSRPFGVNFHMFQPGAAEIIDILIAEKIHAVSFGRGPDAAMIARLRKAGILCVPTVGALKHARKMQDMGVDIIVVQGSEGGGHTGSVTTTVLLPQVLDAVTVPVVAAGGFYDGRGLAAALAYGAAGIAMGTRFLLTAESPVPLAVKQRYLAAQADQIAITTKVDGIPQRMIHNAMLARIERGGGLGAWAGVFSNALALKRHTGASWAELFRSAYQMTSHGGISLPQAMMAANAPALIRKAIVDGDAENGLMASGQVAGTITTLPSCKHLVDSIVEDAYTRLRRLQGFNA